MKHFASWDPSTNLGTANANSKQASHSYSQSKSNVFTSSMNSAAKRVRQIVGKEKIQLPHPYTAITIRYPCFPMNYPYLHGRHTQSSSSDSLHEALTSSKVSVISSTLQREMYRETFGERDHIRNFSSAATANSDATSLTGEDEDQIVPRNTMVASSQETLGNYLGGTPLRRFTAEESSDDGISVASSSKSKIVAFNPSSLPTSGSTDNLALRRLGRTLANLSMKRSKRIDEDASPASSIAASPTHIKRPGLIGQFNSYGVSRESLQTMDYAMTELSFDEDGDGEWVNLPGAEERLVAGLGSSTCTPELSRSSTMSTVSQGSLDYGNEEDVLWTDVEETTKIWAAVSAAQANYKYYVDEFVDEVAS